jgi:hypothetical protein
MVPGSLGDSNPCFRRERAPCRAISDKPLPFSIRGLMFSGANPGGSPYGTIANTLQLANASSECRAPQPAWHSHHVRP